MDPILELPLYQSLFRGILELVLKSLSLIHVVYFVLEAEVTE